MNDCINCNGIGYTDRRGDETTTCPRCNGSGDEPAGLAVVELRKDLDTYDELFSTVNARMTDEEWRPFEAVQDKLYSAVDDNLHLLFGHIDAQAAEIERLKRELHDAITTLESIDLNSPDIEPQKPLKPKHYAQAHAAWRMGYFARLAVIRIKDHRS